jgi:hypothetical protein
MTAHRPVLVGLLLGALPSAALAAAGGLVPVVHGSVGMGACAAAHTDTTRLDNPCWLQLGLAPGLRYGRLEAGLVYEGRDLLDLVTAFLVQPPGATAVGASVGLVSEPGERWRLLLAAEGGWRRYMNFAGHGLSDRKGSASLTYLGATGRAGFGLRPREGRTDRLEVSLSLRSDLGTTTSTADGLPWRVGGWSITIGLGLVSEW